MGHDVVLTRESPFRTFQTHIISIKIQCNTCKTALWDASHSTSWRMFWKRNCLVHLCFFCGGVQSCLICVSFNPFYNPCAWEGEVLFHVHTYRISKACFFAVQKKTKFFMSFCFCVIVNPSCLQSSQLAITTVNLSDFFFENASCKRLVLALVGFGLASFETRFKKLTNTCTRTHIKYLQTGAVHHQNFAWWW